MTTIPELVESERLRLLTEAVAALDAHPDYRVLRRFVPREGYDAELPIGDAPPHKTGLYLDVETTGLDTTTCEIIELAIVPFTFDRYGRVAMVAEGSAFLNDPGVPIPAEVTALTGITDEMVKGKSIDAQWVLGLLPNTSLVIAHNADFDRRVIERRFPSFAQISWGCSYRDVEWSRFGCTSAKLEHLLASTCREFFSAHRALDDCYVGIHVLAAAMLNDRTALSYLLDTVRQPTSRVYATNASFDVKDRLKARKYRWDGTAKVWFIDLKTDAVPDEIAWLKGSAGVYAPRVEKIGARDRYSVRSDR